MLKTFCKNECCKKYIRFIVSGKIICPDCGEEIVVEESKTKEFKK